MNTYTTISSTTARVFMALALLALLMIAAPAQAQVAECVALEEGTWADAVDGSAQGLQKDDAVITGDRADEENTLGPEDWVEGEGTNFFSLGFEGSITLRYDEFVLNVPGTDLIVYEATNGDTYPLEEAEVWVSQTGSGLETDWKQIDNADNTVVAGRTTALDFESSGFDWIKYVRLIDVSDEALHTDDADGFDVDAVFAESAACDTPSDDEGSITITKVYGAAADWSFDFTGTGVGPFTLTNTEQSKIVAAEAGVYTFGEVLLSDDGTDLFDITCTGGATAAVASTTLGNVAVTLAADEDVTCTFTNRPTPDDGGGGDDDSDDLTCSLVTDDSSVKEDEDFTLTWETTNATNVTIDNGIGDVAATGSVVTSIEDDTTFTLTASRFVGENETEESVSCNVEVETRSSGGGGGTRVRDREGDDDGDDSSTNEDDGDAPAGQVLGEQVSLVPAGAPATGAGGTAPAASYAYFGAALFTRARNELKK